VATPFLLAHGHCRLPGAQERAAQIYCYNLVEVIVTHFHQGAVAHYAGIVDHDIDTAKLVHTGVDQAGTGIGIRDGPCNRVYGGAQCGDLFHDPGQGVLVGAVND